MKFRILISSELLHNLRLISSELLHNLRLISSELLHNLRLSFFWKKLNK
jgi:hypothetical protein